MNSTLESKVITCEDGSKIEPMAVTELKGIRANHPSLSAELELESDKGPVLYPTELSPKCSIIVVDRREWKGVRAQPGTQAGLAVAFTAATAGRPESG